ncbi:pentatricopeptide repeat-containing protein At3g22690-like [Ananas comosus]|uniref:Pentatricopeptide repeat-containing protein At3g22690-like n=1 Tax=Ananas comosus TaxID=4615 RepID=A0A6P5FMI5_ANACO|nr:pentatricopeptide repeat-containing protein At3g22690-like [Ananas comosus]
MAFKGNGNQAFKLFSKVIDHGVKPDGLAFVGVLTAYSHAGSVEEGCIFFHSMSNTYGFTPQIVHYGCLVDLLGRAASSSIHRDIEMAEYATKKVLELATEKSGAHVLLSNMYASTGRWNDVTKVRIAEMLSKMSEKASSTGYLPDLANVMLNVEEEEKEDLLSTSSQREDSYLAALIFCGYIIYDTDNLIKSYTYDEYVWAAVALYLNIINLFLSLLTLFRASDVVN